MNILLINPLYEETGLNIQFPLGLGYIAQALLEAKHTVRVLDINAYGWSREEVKKRIEEVDYDVVGIGGLVTVYKYIKWLTLILKNYNPAAKIVVGGSIASTIPELLLRKTQADIAVIREGEITVKHLISSLENSLDLRFVEGVWYKEDGKIIRTSPRQLIENLDEISSPAWELFPIEIYLKTPIIIPGTGRSLNIISNRGCPFQCIFCYRNFGQKVRLRSADNIIKEIRMLKERYKVQHIAFSDELFTVNKERVYEFCDKLIKEKLNITWRCLERVDLVDESMLQKMKAAGCNWIGYGIESGSQEMLNLLKKQTTVEQAQKAIHLTRKAGIIPTGTFMMGMMGETKETIQETVEFCKKTKLVNTFFFTTPYPGTLLYEQIKKMGKIGNEEKFIERLGDATKLTVNLTNFSDERLIQLKEEAENEIWQLYKKSKSLFEKIRCYYKSYGFINLLKKVKDEMIKKIYKI